MLDTESDKARELVIDKAMQETEDFTIGQNRIVSMLIDKRGLEQALAIGESYDIDRLEFLISKIDIGILLNTPEGHEARQNVLTSLHGAKKEFTAYHIRQARKGFLAEYQKQKSNISLQDEDTTENRPAKEAARSRFYIDALNVLEQEMALHYDDPSFVESYQPLSDEELATDRQAEAVIAGICATSWAELLDDEEDTDHLMEVINVTALKRQHATSETEINRAIFEYYQAAADMFAHTTPDSFHHHQCLSVFVQVAHSQISSEAMKYVINELQFSMLDTRSKNKATMTAAIKEGREISWDAAKEAAKQDLMIENLEGIRKLCSEISEDPSFCVLMHTSYQPPKVIVH